MSSVVSNTSIHSGSFLLQANTKRLQTTSVLNFALKTGRGKRLRIPSNKSKAKKLILASAVGGSTLAVGYVVLDNAKIGPLYRFEQKLEKDELPLDYNIEKMEKFFDNRKREIFSRSCEIIAELVPYLCKLIVWEYWIRGKIKDHEGLQQKYAVELREKLTKLGPCFIKLGQAVSIRPDILPSSFLFELQKLCDAVPSYPTKEAIDVIETELGVKVDEIFLDLDVNTKPIAAASLGQVYKLRLKGDPSSSEDSNKDSSAPGPWVGLKVQRPDMHHYVLRDIYIMRHISRMIQWVKTTISNQRPYDVALLDTFAGATLKELDYINEAANQTRCKLELEPRLKNQIYVPKVFDKFTTRKVLVSEWIEGEQLAKSSPDVIRRLIPVGVECFLIQLLETGFFHADPHPGNLLVNQAGQLALIDFGLMADVPIQDTKSMTMTIVHLMQGDVPGLVEDAVQLGFLPQDVDRSSLTPVLQKIFDDAQIAVTNQIKDGAKLQFKAVQSRRKQFWAVSFDLNKIFYLYPFLVPDYFALITRAMIVLEGIAVTGDPEFDLFRAAYPYSLRRAVNLFGYTGIKQIATEAASRMMEMGLEKESAVIMKGL